MGVILTGHDGRRAIVHHLCVTYYLCKKEKFIGYVLLRMILIVCLIVGIMLPVQTIFQILAGIELPIPALITKVFIFIILAAFALYFDRKLKNKGVFYEDS